MQNINSLSNIKLTKRNNMTIPDDSLTESTSKRMIGPRSASKTKHMSSDKKLRFKSISRQIKEPKPLERYESTSANLYINKIIQKVIVKLLEIRINHQIQTNKSANRNVYSIDINFMDISKRKLIFHRNKEGKKLEAAEISLQTFEAFIRQKFEKINDIVLRSALVYYQDFIKLMDKAINKVFKTFLLKYDCSFFKDYLDIITKSSVKFKMKKHEDLQILEMSYPDSRLSVDNYPRYPVNHRKYYNMSKYISPLEKNIIENAGRIYDVKNMLKSDINPECSKNCCCRSDGQEYCKINQFNDRWVTGCNDKTRNIECNNMCECGSECQNNALQKNNQINLEKKVSVKICWGMDLSTRQNICCLMPGRLSLNDQKYYMDKIVSNLNGFGYEGWNITHCLSKLLNDTNSRLEKIKSTYNIPQAKLNSKKSLSNLNKGLTTQSDEKQEDDCNNTKIKLRLVNGDRIINIDMRNENQINDNRTFNCDLRDQEIKIDTKYFVNELKQHDNNSTNESQYVLWYNKLKQEKEVYSVLLKYIRLSQVRAYVRIHSKGLGVICKEIAGISKNSLVTRYMGEIYPIWYWSIKQEAIKTYIKSINNENKDKEYNFFFNGAFYNMILDKHKNEPKGKDVIVVDPILKGNFASRLSHSCYPNCAAFPVISNNQYYIALYAIKNIECGDELTFDYCSITENEKEHHDSICLCGSYCCPGKYLEFTKNHYELFPTDVRGYFIDNIKYFFIEHNAIILKACTTRFTDTMKKYLYRFSIGENTFKLSPDWLKIWSYYILKLIKRERRNLLESFSAYFINESKQQTNYAFLIENLFSQRISNLMISIDKLRHFVHRQPPELRDSKPFLILNTNDQQEYIGNIINSLKSSSIIATNRELINIIKNYNRGTNSGIEYYMDKAKLHITDIDILKILRAKLTLLLLSAKIKEQKVLNGLKDRYKNGEVLTALSDILYLTSFIVVYFKTQSFDSVTVKVPIRCCDLNNDKEAYRYDTSSTSQQLEETSKVMQIIPM